jgi:hypothetical protein
MSEAATAEWEVNSWEVRRLATNSRNNLSTQQQHELQQLLL